MKKAITTLLLILAVLAIYAESLENRTQTIRGKVMDAITGYPLPFPCLVEVDRSTNTVLLNMYWEIGRLIVEEEHSGRQKAEYGKYVLKNLSHLLIPEFGKGFDESNLRNMRQFYLAFPIRDALRHELRWLHYRILSRIEEGNLRIQYMLHAIEGNWNTCSLQRNEKEIKQLIEHEYSIFELHKKEQDEYCREAGTPHKNK